VAQETEEDAMVVCSLGAGGKGMSRARLFGSLVAQQGPAA
jgi:hypothetical protein